MPPRLARRKRNLARDLALSGSSVLCRIFPDGLSAQPGHFAWTLASRGFAAKSIGCRWFSPAQWPIGGVGREAFEGLAPDRIRGASKRLPGRPPNARRAIHVASCGSPFRFRSGFSHLLKRIPATTAFTCCKSLRISLFSNLISEPSGIQPNSAGEIQW